MENSTVGEKQPLINVSENEIKEVIEKQKNILKSTLSCMNALIRTCVVVNFCYGIRSSLFVLYARTFGVDDHIISITIYLNYLVEGITSIISGYIGNYWRYDFIIIIFALCDVLTFWMEALCTNYGTLAVAFIFGEQPISGLIFGAIGKLLPIYNAKQVTNTFLQYVGIFLVFGIATGGIVAYFINYRTAYIIAATIASCDCVYICLLLKFTGTQYEHTQNQLTMKPYYWQIDNDSSWNEHIAFDLLKNKEYRFATCIDNPPKYNADGESIDKMKTFLTLLLIVVAGLTTATEGALCMWYAVYMIDKYNLTILLAECQLCIWPIFFLVAGKIIRKISTKTKILRIMGILSLLFLTILTGICIPQINSIDDINKNEIYSKVVYFIYICIYSFFWGIANNCISLTIVEIQTKDTSGIINGFNKASRVMFKGLGCLAIGYMWSISYEWIWYVQSVMFATSTILFLLFTFLSTL